MGLATHVGVRHVEYALRYIALCFIKQIHPTDPGTLLVPRNPFILDDGSQQFPVEGELPQSPQTLIDNVSA